MKNLSSVMAKTNNNFIFDTCKYRSFLTITAKNIQAQTDTFKPALGTGRVSVASTLVQPDGKILVAGDFNSINTSPINGIARFNPDGTLDASFNTGGGADGTVNSLALQADGKIIIAGTFTGYDSVDVGRIARLNANGRSIRRLILAEAELTTQFLRRKFWQAVKF